MPVVTGSEYTCHVTTYMFKGAVSNCGPPGLTMGVREITFVLLLEGGRWGVETHIPN
jgi:hypothetical protein